MQVGAAKALHTRDLKSGVDISDAALKESWNKVKDDGDSTSWLLLTYGEANNKIVVDSMGAAFDSLLDKLADDKVLFGGLRAVVDGSQSKFFTFLLVGDNVGGMKKGRSALHKNGVFNGVMEAVHGELIFPTRADFTRESATQQISKLTGARQVDL